MYCKCGGSVELITFEENGEILVSHGVCSSCLRGIVLPQEPIVNFRDFFREEGSNMEKVLECSTYSGDSRTPKGDKRFSAWGAKVKVGDTFDYIENHYQLCKRFIENGELIVPKSWKDAKGKHDIAFFEVMGRRYEPKYLSAYYSLLWVKYLDANPSLVEYAKGFDKFTDKYKGKSINCQADVIRKYVKEGRDSIFDNTLVREFMALMRQPHCVREVVGDLLKSDVDVIGHQTNCIGVMGAGIALKIKNMYPNVFAKYRELCTEQNKSKELLGKCQMLSESGDLIDINNLNKEDNEKIIANLFGQYSIGNGLETQYEHLKTALEELKKVGKKHNLWIGLPYKLGSGLAGGDWNVVRKIIEEVFSDYPVTIYKLPSEV